MSCYLADLDKMIITAAWALRESYKSEPPRTDYITDAVKEIWRANVASVEGRYPDQKRTRAIGGDDSMIWWGPAAFVEDPITDGLIVAALELDPRAAHMTARCVDYQSCDFEGYEKTRGYDYIQRAKDNSAYVAASRYCAKHYNGGWPEIVLVDKGNYLLSRRAQA